MKTLHDSQDTTEHAPVGATDATDALALSTWPIARWWRVSRLTLAAIVPALALLAALVLLWQWYASQPDIDAQILPTPLAVWGVLVGQRDILWQHMLVTLQETLIGFALALVAGVIFGRLIDFSPWLRRAIYPLLVASQTIPI